MKPDDIKKAITHLESLLSETPEQASERRQKEKTDEATRQAKWVEIAELKGKELLKGYAASPGLARGTVKNVHERDPVLLAKVQPGEVVVSTWLELEDSEYIKNAVAMIIDSGGKMTSASLFAKSIGITAVLGASHYLVSATHLLKTGRRVIVDGNIGAVFEDVTEKSMYFLDITGKQLNNYRTMKNISKLVKSMEYAESSAIRKRAAKILAEIGTTKVVKSLSLVLLDENRPDEVRLNAASVLAQIGTNQAISALVAVLGDWFKVVREHVALMLTEIGEFAAESVIVALSTGNQVARQVAAGVLGEMKTEKAINPLVAILWDEGEDVTLRSSASKALVRIGTDNGLVEPLLRILDLALEVEDGHWWLEETTEEAIAALTTLGDIQAVEPLIKLVSKHKEDLVTISSVQALGDLGDRKAVKALIEIMKDERTSDCSHLRVATCRALGKLKDKEATKPLVDILEQERKTSYGLEDAAAVALALIDDDNIEVPLLKCMGERLAKMLAATDHALPNKGLMEAAATLLKRLSNAAS